MRANNKTGQEVFSNIFGSKAQGITTALNELSPELGKFAIDFPFGNFYVNDHLLDLKTRELITLSTLITQGTLPQLKLHIEAALNVGCTEIEIEQAILQLFVYVGMPKVINAMTIFKEVKESK